MPPAEQTKRIVSTDPRASGNPLSWSGCRAYLVGPAGQSPLTADAFQKKWDVMIIGDLADDAPVDLTPLCDVNEVLWLRHDQAATKRQEPSLRQLFCKARSFVEVKFHHTADDYSRYLQKVGALRTAGQGYAERLNDLDFALRAENMESEAVELLWLLAAYIDSRDSAVLHATREKYSELSASARLKEQAPALIEAWEAVTNAIDQGIDIVAPFHGLKRTLKHLTQSRNAAGSAPRGQETS